MLNIMRNSSLSLFTTDAETLTMMWQTVLLGLFGACDTLAHTFCIQADIRG